MLVYIQCEAEEKIKKDKDWIFQAPLNVNIKCKYNNV